MNQNEVLAMLHEIIAGNQEYTTWTVSTPHLVMLVNKAVEAEREECAKVCEVLKPFGPELALQKATAEDCAAAIRARGQE